MMVTSKLCVLIIIATLVALMVASETNPKHVNIILVGATGDLAKKYLWNAFFDLFSKHYKTDVINFSIYAGATKKPDEGRMLISQILLETIKCNDHKCRSKKKFFVESVQYVQLKSEKNYEKLSELIAENTLSFYGNLAHQVSYEQARLVYLSIPPSAYKKSSRLVDTYLRPQLGRPWFRVVYEKPFGRDYTSALNLANEISRHFRDDEVYRVDHYLGKDIVKLILPFRYVNQEYYESIWNRDHIEKIEVVMKERLDVHDRTLFYEEVGVIRDVMQNHLTELLTLITMDLPENSGNITEILHEKTKLLSHISPIALDDLVIGQYCSYMAEAIAERERDNFTSSVPTFATALLRINTPRWKGVPILMMSGKKLDEKTSYVRVVFKSQKFCMNRNVEVCNPSRQIVFHIGSGDPLKPPMILVSKSLHKPKEFPSWRHEEMHTDMSMFEQHVNDMYQLMASKEADAYTALLHAVYNGERHMFTTTDTLLKAWTIWTPVLKDLSKAPLRMYEGHYVDADVLDVMVTPTGISFINDADDVHQVDLSLASMKMTQIPSTFLGGAVVSDGRDTVIGKLAMDIEAAAHAAIQERGVFHLALSGGGSPKRLYRLLAHQFHLFPWQHTHIWQVDERCVGHSEEGSNFAMLDVELLQSISVPHTQVHSMPVHLSDDPCNPQDEGHIVYQSALKRHLNSSSGFVDYILLGIGVDGHTASLFPGEPALTLSGYSDPWVIATKAPESYTIQNRMTLTLPVINSAHQVSVLVLGSGKHKILQELEQAGSTADKYPIMAVTPTNGKLTWYIDHEALFGKEKV